MSDAADQAVHSTSVGWDTELDPFDPELVEVPYEEMAALRVRCPVARMRSSAFFVSRHADVTTVARDAQTYKSDGAARPPGVVVPDEEKFPFEIDAPRHRWMRPLWANAVPAVKVRQAEAYIAGVAERLIDAMCVKGTADVISELADLVPAYAMAHLMGLSTDDVPRLVAWTREVVTGGFAAYHQTETGFGLEAGIPDFMGYISREIELRESLDEPGSDVISKLLHAEIDGNRLSRIEVMASVYSLFVAGADTTRNLIGNIIYQLAVDPGLRDSVRADRGLVGPLVEETLRFHSPVFFLGRLTARDTQLCGAAIPEGSKIMMGIASANRDVAVFDEPDSFRMDRGRIPHLTFGIPGSPHYCLGALLARTEATAVVNALLDRVAEIGILPTNERLQPRLYAVTVGFASLWVTLT